MDKTEKLDIIRDVVRSIEWNKFNVEEGKEYDKEELKHYTERNEYVDKIANEFIKAALKEF